MVVPDKSDADATLLQKWGDEKMGAERGKTQNTASLFRKNREGYMAFTVGAYTVR
jgi:hypothetical protein